MFCKPVCTITIIALLTGCTAKHVPEKVTATKSTAAPATSKPATVPKVIAVNDKAAKKNFDGRLYYDLNGHRYWRNYNDGKYYLFNKRMYTDSAFIPH
ncbi:MAG: hypothetical protein JST86_01575 [Bacteroidetes bacterium]|nr:hypothetical protein [Bacteroidota bacterium]